MVLKSPYLENEHGNHVIICPPSPPPPPYPFTVFAFLAKVALSFFSNLTAWQVLKQYLDEGVGTFCARTSLTAVLFFWKLINSLYFHVMSIYFDLKVILLSLQW